MMIAPLPVVLVIFGLLMWLLASRPPAPSGWAAFFARIGEIMFACGLLALAFSQSGHTVRLFGP